MKQSHVSGLKDQVENKQEISFQRSSVQEKIGNKKVPGGIVSATNVNVSGYDSGLRFLSC